MASKEIAKTVVIEEEKKQQEEEAANAVGGGGDEADAPPQAPAEEEPDTVGMYSVWAIPPDYVLPSLHLVMTQLSERYAGPPFQPHVTVLGAHPVLLSKAQQSLQQLCASILPYTFKITGVTTDLKFHQCVYLTMEPTQEAVDAHIQAQCCFGFLEIGDDTTTMRKEYMPHMSLLYGHLLEEELEEAKAKVEAEHGKQLIGMQFQVSSLGLYCTDPADVLCKSWKMVCQLPLRAPKR
ncbi:unnamed protein product [Sphagnum balticum]